MKTKEYNLIKEYIKCILEQKPYVKGTTKNLYLDRPFKSYVKYGDPVNVQITRFLKGLGLLDE